MLTDRTHIDNLLSNIRDLLDSPVTYDFRTASVTFLVTTLHRSYLLLSSDSVRENAEIVERVSYSVAALLVLRTYILSRSAAASGSASASASVGRRRGGGGALTRLCRTALALWFIGLAALVGWYHEVHHVAPPPGPGGGDSTPANGQDDDGGSGGPGMMKFTISNRVLNYGTFPTDEAVAWARGKRRTEDAKGEGGSSGGENRLIDDGGDPFAIYPLKPHGEWFVEKGDDTGENGDGDGDGNGGGRVAMIRAINLSGGSKIPTVDSPSSDPKLISFVGRPFPIGTPSERADAEVHLARIRSYGFNALRLIVTWEAIEHSGPGIHDHEYLNYIREIVRLCDEFALGVIIDLHQDVWSRVTGGDGAPSWTLDVVGFDVPNLFTSGAAVNSDDFPDVKMLWPTNYARLAPATMFTLFFAGDVYAPKCKIEGSSAQGFLRRHYLNSVRILAETLKDEPNVIGYDTLNEPSTGYVGSPDLRGATFPAPMGWYTSAYTSMTVPSGVLSPEVTRSVPVFRAPFVLDRMEVLNPTNVSAWKDPIKGDVWRNEGVWDVTGGGEVRLLRPEHFALNADGQPVDFVRDYMVPFFREFADVVREVHPGVVIFAEPHIDPGSPVHGAAPLDLLLLRGGGDGDDCGGGGGTDGGDDEAGGGGGGGSSGERYYWAWAPHFYDASTLLLKDYRPWFFLDYQSERPVLGEERARYAIGGNLAHVRRTATSTSPKASKNLSVPVIVGEIGIPMDMHSGSSYVTGDYSNHVHALDRSIGGGLESNLLSYALWNYSPDNTNDEGDGWNGEDLSIYSNDQRRQQLELDGRKEDDAEDDDGMVMDIYAGGRAIEAAVRPYPTLICGTPVESKFDPLHPDRPYRLVFETTTTSTSTCTSNAYTWCVDPVRYPTVIFVPRFQYPNGVRCVVSDGTYEYDRERQILTYVHDVSARGVHTVTIKRL